jgi:hypothetical protein
MASSKKSSKAAAKPTATTIVGEDKAPLTTLALGEEHVVTTIVGEQAQPSEELSAAAEASGAAHATTVVGETWHPHLPITTLMVGEEHGGGGTVFTTLALGEEGSPTTVAGEDAGALSQSPTTTATGEEGGGGPVTTATGEQGGLLTTDAIGEEGPIVTTVVGEHSYISLTTYVVGEEGPIVTTVVGEHHHVPVITTVAGEEPQGGGSGGGPFGSF